MIGNKVARSCPRRIEGKRFDEDTYAGHLAESKLSQLVWDVNFLLKKSCGGEGEHVLPSTANPTEAEEEEAFQRQPVLRNRNVITKAAQISADTHSPRVLE